MVTEQLAPATIVIAGVEGPLGRHLAALYVETGHDVVQLSMEPGADPSAMAARLDGLPISLLIFTDDYMGDDADATTAKRKDLTAALQRLVYVPFRLATLLYPSLMAGNGKLILLSRKSAGMEQPNDTGRFLERPFRAAAHALWRCLSIEWRDSGVRCGLIALGSPLDDEEIQRLPQAIANAGLGNAAVELTDVGGRRLGW
jgi:NAD(P)-dependent dehydrogenase (short-subunit alcohol dehydrogenase family)